MHGKALQCAASVYAASEPSDSNCNATGSQTPKRPMCALTEGWCFTRRRLQVYALMEKGAAERVTGSTMKNHMSSRSHAVFIFIVEKSSMAMRSEDGGGRAASVEAAAHQLEQLRACLPNSGGLRPPDPPAHLSHPRVLLESG